MYLKDIVHAYIKQPFPLWEHEITETLVQNKWNELKKFELKEQIKYSTARCVNGDIVAPEIKIPISENSENEIVYLEIPPFNSLQDFYNEHGLIPMSVHELERNSALIKLKSALAIINLIKPIHLCITKLVRAIQLLHQENSNIDVSYSHPKVPFSIFLSVCEDNSTLSSMRVAESILHEAMHLKLTLIENVVQLVKPNTGNLYFSPWRDDKRPAQGVLHGLFVFRTLLDFFTQLNDIFCSKKKVHDYLTNRKEQIRSEIIQIEDFHLCPDLTKYGAILTKNLLP